MRASLVREGRTPYNRPLLKNKITSSQDVYDLLLEYHDKEQEHFILITLDGASRVIQERVISLGTINQTLVHPREVFRNAICDNAAGIIVAHNHPSGQLEASLEDREVTKRLKEVGTLIGIELLDHVIFTVGGHISLRDEGML